MDCDTTCGYAGNHDVRTIYNDDGCPIGSECVCEVTTTTTTTLCPDIQSAGPPVTIRFGTYTIPDELEVFDVCQSPEVSLLNTGKISTGTAASPGTGYPSGWFETTLNNCPECLKFCVTADLSGTLWWIEVDDSNGGTVLSLAGGQNSSDGVCYGQTCSIPAFSFSDTETYGQFGGNAASYTTSLSLSSTITRPFGTATDSLFTYKSAAHENEVAGFGPTCALMVETASDDNYDTDEYGAKNAGAAVFIICSGGRYWDFSSHVNYNDFTVNYEVLDEDTGEFSFNSETYNYKSWTACIEYDVNGASTYPNCVGKTQTLYYNTPKPAFPTPNN